MNLIIKFKELLTLSGNKKEFGDYQTPIYFCNEVCSYLKKQGIDNIIEAIIEPTCGLGNFILSAVNTFQVPAIGIDINRSYIRKAQKQLPSANFLHGNIFDISIADVCKHKNVLIIGNPPWATNSDLDFNLPKKSNFKELKGIEALTGASNFDICEYVILQMLNAYKGTDSVICMLCKTSVARNVIMEIDRNSIPCNNVEILNFNSHKVFGISVAACIVIIQLTSNKKFQDITCQVKDFDSLEVVDTLVVNNHHLTSKSSSVQDFEGTCQLAWRSGVKHDCGKVMELELVNGNFVNKYKEIVDVEDDLVFPLVYLSSHSDDFSKRKSVIYKNSGSFSMFGIGDYSFAPYKVGVSGFYKKPLFSLLTADKPVMTDDTSYFLSFDNYDDAYTMMLLLNSQPIQEYLTSIAFLDSKRPYTVKLLSRVDLKKCFSNVSLNELKHTESILDLPSLISQEMYSKLKNKVS